MAEGRADLATIDALTWQLLAQYEPWVAKLRKVTVTAPPTPTLPYITAKGADADLYFRVTSQPRLPHFPRRISAVLHLRGLIRIPAAAYLAVPTPPAPAQIAQLS